MRQPGINRTALVLGAAAALLRLNTLTWGAGDYIALIGVVLFAAVLAALAISALLFMTGLECPAKQIIGGWLGYDYQDPFECGRWQKRSGAAKE